MEHAMPVQQLARDEVIHASTETPLVELAETMREATVGSVVITNDREPVGIVTDRDITTRVVADGSSPSDLVAGDIMSTDVCTVGADAGFYEAAKAMSDHGVRRLPICDDDGHLTGIITADDLTELLADEFQHLAGVIQSQRPPY